MGTLSLDDPSSLQIEENIHGLIMDHGEIQTKREHIAETVAEITKSLPVTPKSEDNVTWIPSKNKKIKTNKAVVLGNESHGFKEPNIMDCKLGVRLWADDAPLQKKERFDKIAAETTHKTFGFRIAGMRVYRGSSNLSELNEDGYKIYDKDYGRVTINDSNIMEAFRTFVFNKTAGIDEDTGKAICAAFVNDLKNVQEVLESEESRMYSASLLFMMEGDGDALREAIEENNAAVERINSSETASDGRTTKRVDSGIVLDDEDSDIEDEFSSLPKMYSLKLIDFAHAEWTPGLGPDENSLKGVRSLVKIFEELAQ